MTRPTRSTDDADDPPAVTAKELAGFRDHLASALPAILADLRVLVNVDCGSYTKAGVDTVGRWTADAFVRLGAAVDIRAHETFGNTVVGRFAGDPARPRILLVGHLDTVFGEGTAAARPFRIDDGIARGPGVTDMKSGLLAGLRALEAIQAVSPGGLGAVTFIANPDEEIGSPTSTPIIAAAAVEADVCLVLECARANGDIVSARKGALDLHVDITGRAAHAGVEPEKGRSALLEAANQVVALHGLNGRWPGVSVNVGVVSGGTRPNVVAASAHYEVDIRAPSRALFEEAEAAVREIAGRPTIPDTSTTVTEHGRHWPMERLAASERLIEHATSLAGRLGFPLRDAATGGASDANTTAGLGVPTLDGLGPVGGNDHSPEEYLEVASIVPRTTLLAGLLLAISRDPGFGHRA